MADHNSEEEVVHDADLPWTVYDVDALPPMGRSGSWFSAGQSIVQQHVVAGGGMLENIKLVRADVFQALQVPLPRSQDLLSSAFGTPRSQDLVVAVSHAWRNQTHPDPSGRKHSEICVFVENLQRKFEDRTIFIFFDFLSISQRPFQVGQEERTAEETERFFAALGQMHNMYFLADYVIHLGFELDGELIQGEGDQYIVPVLMLRNVVVSQVGDWWQITQIEEGDRQSRRNGQSRRESPMTDEVSLFDRVVSVDGRELESLEHLQQDLEGARPIPALCALQRYPFGRVNRIPADERGWVFLERFITAAKCAMLLRDQAVGIIITDSPATEQQILTIAERLRGAAQHNVENGSQGDLLAKELDACFSMLETKRFSAASTDKRLLDSDQAINPDSVVVKAIMQEFTHFLGEHWNTEEAKQRHQAKRLGATALQVATDYFLSWDSFSEARLAEIEAASTLDPAVFFLLLVVPIVLPLALCLAPYLDPSLPPQRQGWFWLLGMPLAVFTVNLMFPFFLAATVGMQLSRSAIAELFAYASGVAVLTTLVIFCLSWGLGMFPMPCAPLIAASLAMGAMPLLWLYVPFSQRGIAAFRRRAVDAMLGVILLIVVSGIALPLVNTLLVSIESEALQALILLCYVIIKLGFERVGRYLASRLGADAMPCFIWVASYSYEINLCHVLAKGFSWVHFVELIAFDAIENGYHMWSLRRQWGEKRDVADAEDRRRQYFIVAELLIREFIEVVVVLSFLVDVAILRVVQPEFVTFLCPISDAEFQTMVLLLLLDLGVELLMALSTYWFLVRHGFSPLRTLRGLVASYFPVFFACACSGSMYYMACQVTQFGMDYSFQFLWVTEASSRWRCGLTWEVP